MGAPDSDIALKKRKLMRKKAKSAAVGEVQLAAEGNATDESSVTRANKKKPAVVAPAAAVVEEQKQKDDVQPDMVGDVSFRRTQTDKRQSNAQKVLVIGSRQMSGKGRHLLNDLAGIMAHGRPHPKLDVRKDVGSALQELCDLHRCNGALFLESRKHENNYLWIAQAPEGPSLKLQLHNLHTADELRMVGNCLKYSRPLLHFDAEFETVPHLRVARALLTTSFNTPRYHPRSKPFVDHIICFFVLDGKIYFRHYQVLEQQNGQFSLTEIGPRFVMDPQVLLQGCCRGSVVWKSETAVAPTVQRMARKERAREKVEYNERVQQQGERHRTALPEPGPDPLGKVFHKED